MGSNWADGPQTGNNDALISDNSAPNPLWILNISGFRRNYANMKNAMLSLAIAALIAIALPAHAAGCYADYKAKQDNPLRLHYGVAQINGACNAGAARAELSGRLAAQGWTLLNIVSVFGQDGLAQRRNSAGPNYLRF